MVTVKRKEKKKRYFQKNKKRDTYSSSQHSKNVIKAAAPRACTRALIGSDKHD